MVYAQPNISPGEEDAQILMGFRHTDGSPNLRQKTRPYNNYRKKRTCRIVGLADPADPADRRVKLKESEKKDKFLDLNRELKNFQT